MAVFVRASECWRLTFVTSFRRSRAAKMAAGGQIMYCSIPSKLKLTLLGDKPSSYILPAMLDTAPPISISFYLLRSAVLAVVRTD